jgi:hypothetical protein
MSALGHSKSIVKCRSNLINLALENKFQWNWIINLFQSADFPEFRIHLQSTDHNSHRRKFEPFFLDQITVIKIKFDPKTRNHSTGLLNKANHRRNSPKKFQFIVFLLSGVVKQQFLRIGSKCVVYYNLWLIGESLARSSMKFMIFLGGGKFMDTRSNYNYLTNHFFLENRPIV